MTEPYYEQDGLALYQGDVLDTLAQLPPDSVDCVVTSPPYWSLRNYSGEQARIWGGDPSCEHDFSAAAKNGATIEGYAGTKRWQHSENGRGEAHPEARNHRDNPDVWTRITRGSGICRCGAWQGGYGLEPTPELYVEHTVTILRAIRRVLKPTGVVFWNIGDGYAGSRGNYGGSARTAGKQREIFKGSHVPNAAYAGLEGWRPPNASVAGLKPKDMIAMPWRVGMAAQADGWWLRADIIWAKPNPMSESVRDRPTKSHEYILLLTKSARYFWDQDAVREPFLPGTIQRITQETLNGQQGGFKQEQYDADLPGKKGRDRRPAEILKAMGQKHRDRENFRGGTDDPKLAHKGFKDVYPNEGGRNIRSVWTMATQPSPLPHFASFPEELASRCIRAGTPPDGTVLDPFAGTATTLKVARDLGKKAIGIELSAEYCELARKRMDYGIKGVMAMQNGQHELGKEA